MASRPASQIVLVRLGDRAAITQADFERWARAVHPELYDSLKHNAMALLLERERLCLYVQDHPDLVPKDQLEAMLEETMKLAKATTREEFEKKLKEKGLTFEEHRTRHVMVLAKSNIIKRGIALAKDEELVNKILEANPDHFDGSKVTARHIFMSVLPYETPAQREAKRRRLAKIREDLIAGRRSWTDCVQENQDNTKFTGGILGAFTRHMEMAEPVAAAAWALEVNELSNIVESHLGFHLIETLECKPGGRTPKQAKEAIRRWLERKQYPDAIAESARKYPTVGVRPPIRPAWLPAPGKPSRGKPRRGP